MMNVLGVDLTKPFSHKIKTLDELCAELGSIYRPHRTRSVVLCHGVFDLVHPGHLRHLLYAKSKADILVASITPDIHVDKAKYRPFVPQQLRAINLAALEMVDYVLIDTEKTPLGTISALQPDFLAKGYEYQRSGISSATEDEIIALKSYGGEMIFTPGDVVYSSTALIEAAPPDLVFDKLRLLMETAKVDFAMLRGLIEAARGVSVHVVGDTIVDTLTYTTQLGGVSKTPTPSVQYEREEHFIGGAAIVALHLAAAGAQVTFSTVLGDRDAGANFVLEEMPGRIKINYLVDTTRPTTSKNAFVCNGYRLLKVDTVDSRPISDHILTKLSEHIEGTKTNAIVFSDFRHGIFNKYTIPTLVGAIPKGLGMARIADSQVASRWGNVVDFQNFDMITPNEREARFALGDQDSGVLPLVGQLQEAANCSMALMKLGRHGVVGCINPLAGKQEFFALDSFARRVLDPVGAGDAFLAYAALAMTLEGAYTIAPAVLGSIAAALECEVDGNVPVSAHALLARLTEIEKCVS